MAKQIIPQDQYADIQFPMGGVDLSLGFGGQRPNTAREGINVRTCEPLAQADRGGCRPGLDRYIDDQTGGSNLVQHLNYVVDPQAEAMPWYDPPYPNPADPTAPGIAGGPNFFGPSLFYTDPDGNVIRYGGTGIRYRKKRKTSSIQARAGGKNSPDTTTQELAYLLAVSAGDLLVVTLSAFARDSTGVMAISDTRGNTWALAKRVNQSFLSSSSADTYQLSLAMWYCITAAGADTVTVTMVGGGGANLMEMTVEAYPGVAAVSPLRASAGLAAVYNNVAAPVTPPADGVVDTGSLAAAGADYVVAAFTGVNSIGDFTAQSGFNVRISNDQTKGPVTLVQDYLGVAGPADVTATAGSLSATDVAYAAVSAAFKKA